MGMMAWVTSAFDGTSAEQAIVLAGSLRRVKTIGKLVVITSTQVSEITRNRLHQSFDLVSLLDITTPKTNVAEEEYAKIFAFSLGIFNACVFLPPNSLVLKKCDELLLRCDALDFFIGMSKYLPKSKSSGIFTLKPSVAHFRSLKEIFMMKTSSCGDGSAIPFHTYLLDYAENNNLKVEELNDRYYQHLDFYTNGVLLDRFIDEVAIVNFGNVDPKSIRKPDMPITTGLMESFAMDLWWNIYHEEIYMTHSSPQLETITQPNNEYDPIAIVGMSCRYPGANSLSEFWKLLIDGREGIKPIPSHRWQKSHTITTASSKCRTTNGGFLDFPVDEFDSKFFNMSPIEAEFVDPQQRLLHELSWEAFEDAGIDPTSLRGSYAGVFVGSWIHDYKDIALKTADKDFFRIYMGNSLAATAARLSYFYNFTGPSIASESGCSSAILAVDLACKSLRNRETKIALTCGVNLFLHPFTNDSISFVLAPDGRCKTFDAKADGFGRAEGVGVLILKRMSDAIADGDNIWALIRGTGVSQEGVSKSLGTPTVHCESLAMKKALENAGVHPKEVSFVETHGTGTSVGDPMEISAITQVYSKDRTRPLLIGSTKTNLGHTEAASGITGIIKVVLSMKNEMIPPHLNFDTLNPEISLDAIPAEIPLKAVDWRRSPGIPRIAGVSSFGISGTDGHAIVQEAPNYDEPMIDLNLSRPLHIMKITGKTGEALDGLLGQYEKMFVENEENDFGNIAYTANIGRATFNHRAVIVAKDSKEAAKMLKAGSFKRREVHVGLEAKICFLFTGQGSQYPEMGKELYKSSPVFRMAFDKCDAILSRYNIKIHEAIWTTESQNLLSKTIYSQISIFVIEYCLIRLWESWGIKANYVLGHSLGEFAAAVCANILTLEDALTLVVKRSLLIDALPNGKMLVVKADKTFVEQLLSEFWKHEESKLDFAALNSPEQTVLAGDSEAVDSFCDFCSNKEVKFTVLASSHAFHSRQMDPILVAYRKNADEVLLKAKQTRYGKIKSKFISGMEGCIIEEGDLLLNSDYWVKHTREKVNFVDAAKIALQEGCNVFLEVGPSPVLLAFVMGNSPGWNSSGSEMLCLPSLRKNQNDWVTLLESLGRLFLSDFSNMTINWKGFDQYYGRRKVELPFHPFFKKKVWVNFRSTPGKVHPLVGRIIPNASKSTVFENEITLKGLRYLNDHAIGSTVIYPGAAFLEMCVVAGHCAVQGQYENLVKPRRPVTLKNLRIEAPLPLQDGKSSVLQTVVDLAEMEENGKEQLGYCIKVHNWFEDPPSGDCPNFGTDLLSGQWKTHASATFLPLSSDDFTSNLPINLGEMKESWEKVSAAKELYEKLPEVGLQFGSTFQSLTCGWREKTEVEDSKTEERGSGENGILFEVKVPSDDHESYMVHPVILDAMLQASMIWMSRDRLHKKLHVPVYIKEFTWVAEGKDNLERYVYCTKTKQDNDGESIGSLTTLLLDGDGVILATMSGIEFIETTVKLVESVIQQQSYTMPQVWEEIWKPKGGHLQASVSAAPMDELSGNTMLSDEIIQACKKYNELDEVEIKVYKHLDNLTILYFLNALYKLGWRPEVGDRIELKAFMNQFGILDVGWNFMKYFFNEMVAENFVERVGSLDKNEYLVRKTFGSQEIENLCEETVEEGERLRGDYRIISEMGKGLADFLVGNSSPLNTLFPEDTSKPNMGCFYDAMRNWVSKTGRVLNNALSNYRHLFNKGNKSVTFRVLEVGAGTGSATKDCLEFLESKDVNLEYTFTDISAAFFINAEVKFEKYKDVMKYRKFDIDYDALAQGFTPEYYDLIVACEVLHAAKDIRKTLSNLRMLLKTNGHIQITETTKPDRRITLMVGLLEGYWRFTDTDLRPDHATMSSQKWCKVLNESGYKMAGSVGCYCDVHSYIYAFGAEDYSIETGNKSVFEEAQEKGIRIMNEDKKFSWLVFCNGSEVSKLIQTRLKRLNRNVVVIKKSAYYGRINFDPEKGGRKIVKTLKKLEGDMFEGILYLWALSPDKDDGQERISLPFLHLCQGVLELTKINARLLAMTRGAYLVQEDSACLNPQSATIWGISKTLRNEQPDLSITSIDLSPDKDLMEQANEMFYELFWTNDGEELIAYRGGKRYISKLAAVKMTDESLKLLSFCDRFQLVLPETKAITDLEFGFLNKYKLKEDEIEVQVKAAALNFRDIFAVLKPTAQFDSINSIGSDFAGMITRVGEKVKKWKVGDCVFGMNTEQQALPSHVKTREDMVIGIPTDLTFSEAATIPAVFATALYCLVSVAKIKKGDVVLIHTASGGVGLSAIQIAKHFGASIIATAGSRRKRAYLRSIGIQHVFHSRNTEYEEEIMRVTGGHGVNIVLNSLTGPGFKEATLKVCGEGARYIEMSKLNIWKPEEVRELRSDVEYTVADLTALKEEEWKDLLDKMIAAMKEHFVIPIPYTRFDALNIRQALNYLQKAKHIGKVVCTMPETNLCKRDGDGKSGCLSKSNLFNERSTYLITGGLGGIGFETAKFMLESGAKFVILVSRSKPKNDVEKAIKSWNEERDKRVEAWQVDVGDYDQVKEMMHRIRKDGWPSLRGVMHAAGVLQDGTIPNQTWENFEKTYNAKLKGTINLHEVTKDLRLEHFVLFSSVTSLFGSPGQANHSASNAFEDAFAHYRHSIGLNATTINWANWGEVGVATEIDFPGIRPIATRQGMRALEAVLKSNRLQISVMNVDSFGMVAKLFPKVKGYVDDKRLLGDVKAPVLIINTDQFWGDVDKAEGRESKIDVFKTYIKNMLKSTLKMDPDENIDDNAEFQGLGVDSLMLLEMKNYLQNLFGHRLTLSAAHLKDCNSTGALATRLVEVMEKRNRLGEEGIEDDGTNESKASSETSENCNQDDVRNSLEKLETISQPIIV